MKEVDNHQLIISKINMNNFYQKFNKIHKRLSKFKTINEIKNKVRRSIINSSNKDTLYFADFLQSNNVKSELINFFNENMQIQLIDVIYNGIERLKGIAEYKFYLFRIVGITKNNERKNIFIKVIKKGKIKESLFCICDLVYEKYFNNTKDDIEKPKRITILENKENTKYIKKVSVNLFEDTIRKEKFKVNLDINFIEISKLIKQNKIKKGWEKYIDINHENILLVGLENKY